MDGADLVRMEKVNAHVEDKSDNEAVQTQTVRRIRASEHCKAQAQ